MSQAFKISVKISSLVNRTTQVEIRDGKRYFGGKQDKSLAQAEIHFIEFNEKGFRLDVPPRMCSTGHKLEILMEFTTPQKIISFRAEATVGQIEAYAHSHDSISVSLTQYDSSDWYFIQKLYVQRQAGVADLFERLKGSGA